MSAGAIGAEESRAGSRWFSRTSTLASLWERHRALALVALLAFAVRLLTISYYANSWGDIRWDFESYRIVADLVRSGTEVYAATDRHPYLPFHMYIIAGASYLAEVLPGSFYAWIRVPNVLADVGIAAMIYAGSLRLGRAAWLALALALAWAFHPVSLLVSGVHAQFDAIPIFFTLLAWYFARFRDDGWGGLLCGLALGLAITSKTWPAIFLPVFLLAVPGIRPRLYFLAAAAAVPLGALGLYEIIFDGDTDLIRTKVFDYAGVWGRYGYTYAFDRYLDPYVPASWVEFTRRYHQLILLYAMMAAFALTAPRRDILSPCIAMLLAFYVATYGFGSQYILWVIPFALMANRWFFGAIYSAVATASMVVYFWGTCGFQCPAWFSDGFEYWPLQWIWPVSIVWLGWEMFNGARILGLRLWRSTQEAIAVARA